MKHVCSTSTCRIFCFTVNEWCETKAIELAKDHEVVAVEVRQLVPLLGLIGVEEIDPVRPIDLSVPVILGHMRGASGKKYGLIPIDGWHRIALAAALGIEELPAVALTPDEDRLARARYR